MISSAQSMLLVLLAFGLAVCIGLLAWVVAQERVEETPPTDADYALRNHLLSQEVEPE